MQDRKYAGFFIRLSAYLIDMLILQSGLVSMKVCLWVMRLFGGNTVFFDKKVFFGFTFWHVFSYAVVTLYFILLTYYSGRTIGKMAMRIRVVSCEQRRLSLFEVVFRETVAKYLSGIIINIGYFMIGPDSKKRGLHDRLSDTRVVYDMSYGTD